MGTKKRKKSSTRTKRVSTQETVPVEEGQIIGQPPETLTNQTPKYSKHITKIYYTLVVSALCLTSIAIIRQTTKPADSDQPPTSTTTAIVSTEMQLPDTPPPDVFIFPDKEVEL